MYILDYNFTIYLDIIFMKVVCVKNKIENDDILTQSYVSKESLSKLNFGKVYNSELVFFINDSSNDKPTSVDWKNNFLTMKLYIVV